MNEQFLILAAIVFVYPFTASFGLSTNDVEFEREKVLDGKLGHPSKRILTTKAPTMIACAYACHEVASCRSIAFQSSSGQCNGYNEIYNAFDRDRLKDAADYMLLNKIGGSRLPDVDCVDILVKNPSTSSGVYTVQPAKSWRPIRVSCDMYTDGGGWTVFQYQSGRLLTNRTFLEYEYGFGDLSFNHWLGLKTIYQMTNGINTDLCMFFHDTDNGVGNEKLGKFYIDEGPGYTFHVGNVIDRSDYIVGMQNVSSVVHESVGQNFSTYDFNKIDVALQYGKGGWWYGAKPTLFTPNGEYGTPGTSGKVSGNFIGVVNLPFSANRRLIATKLLFRRVT